jgi:hypothetical protein
MVCVGGDPTAARPIELCGGTHVGAPARSGRFLVTAEEAASAGVRRIEACRPAAVAHVQAAARRARRRAPARSAPSPTSSRPRRQAAGRAQGRAARGGPAARQARRRPGAAAPEARGRRRAPRDLALDGLDAAALRNAADTLMQRSGADLVVVGSGPCWWSRPPRPPARAAPRPARSSRRWPSAAAGAAAAGPTWRRPASRTPTACGGDGGGDRGRGPGGAGLSVAVATPAGDAHGASVPEVVLALDVGEARIGLARGELGAPSPSVAARCDAAAAWRTTSRPSRAAAPPRGRRGSWSGLPLRAQGGDSAPDAAGARPSPRRCGPRACASSCSTSASPRRWPSARSPASGLPRGKRQEKGRLDEAPPSRSSRPTWSGGDHRRRRRGRRRERPTDGRPTRRRAADPTRGRRIDEDGAP